MIDITRANLAFEEYIKNLIHEANNSFYAIVDIDHDYNDILPSDQK